MASPPQPDDREIVQMMAAQEVVMDNHDQLSTEYGENILRIADKYDIEIDEERLKHDLDMD